MGTHPHARPGNAQHCGNVWRSGFVATVRRPSQNRSDQSWAADVGVRAALWPPDSSADSDLKHAFNLTSQLYFTNGVNSWLTSNLLQRLRRSNSNPGVRIIGCKFLQSSDRWLSCASKVLQGKSAGAPHLRIS